MESFVYFLWALVYVLSLTAGFLALMIWAVCYFLYSITYFIRKYFSASKDTII